MTQPGRMSPRVATTYPRLDAVVTQAVLDYKRVLEAVAAGRASAQQEGEALGVLRECLVPGIAEAGR